MRYSKTGRKTSSVASPVWHVVPSCWNQMLPISSSSIFVNKNSFKMAHLCLGTKIRTKQWLILGASAFQSMRACFLYPKCDNFACLRTRQERRPVETKCCQCPPLQFLWTKILSQHDPITIAIDCNGLSLLIFEEKWPDIASGPKSAPWIGCVGFSMYACGFSVLQMRQFCLFT